MAVARSQNGHFAHDPFTIDQIHSPARVGDSPMAGDQLHPFVGLVLDPDVIDPEPFPRVGLRLFRQEIHRHANGNPIGNRGMLEQLFHRRTR